MNLRTAITALAAATLVAGVPMLAAAQPGPNVTASRPVPNPPERAGAMHHGKMMKHPAPKHARHMRHVHHHAKHRGHAAHN